MQPQFVSSQPKLSYSSWGASTWVLAVGSVCSAGKAYGAHTSNTPPPTHEALAWCSPRAARTGCPPSCATFPGPRRTLCAPCQCCWQADSQAGHGRWNPETWILFPAWLWSLVLVSYHGTQVEKSLGRRSPGMPIWGGSQETWDFFFIKV